MGTPYSCLTYAVLTCKIMQKSGTEAIRTQLQPSKPKREITNITNSQNTNRTYCQPSEQLFPNRCYVLSKNKYKKSQYFCMKINFFTSVKNCSVLHRRVCVMVETHRNSTLFRRVYEIVHLSHGGLLDSTV